MKIDEIRKKSAGATVVTLGELMLRLSPPGNERFLQSPLFEADQLARPLFLAHGLSDLNVHFRHSARFARALAEAGIDAETHFFPEEGHGVSTPSSRALLFHRLTRFLERHLIPASQRFPN